MEILIQSSRDFSLERDGPVFLYDDALGGCDCIALSVDEPDLIELHSILEAEVDSYSAIQRRVLNLGIRNRRENDGDPVFSASRELHGCSSSCDDHIPVCRGITIYIDGICAEGDVCEYDSIRVLVEVLGIKRAVRRDELRPVVFRFYITIRHDRSGVLTSRSNSNASCVLVCERTRAKDNSKE